MSWPVEVSTAERGVTPVCGPGRSILVYDCFWTHDPEPQYFLWGCPLCGNVWSGWFEGPKPMPQGHHAVWRNSGSRERPTLSPSLVCHYTTIGRCSGHFLIRDGELVAA